MPAFKNNPDLQTPKRDKTSRPRVGIWFTHYRGFSQYLLSGIIHYANQHGPWNFIHYPSSTVDTGWQNWLEPFAQADGLIVGIRHPDMKKALKKLNKPTVVVLGADKNVGFPHVMSDHFEIGRMAADYFTNMGFKQFAFVGGDCSIITSRREGYVQAVGKRPLSMFHVKDDPLPLLTHKKRLKKWLTEIPKPIGLFAASLIDAPHVLEMCHELGISVPEQVSVLSVDHDPLFCRLTTPPLSSIDPGIQRTGYEAAKMLNRLFNGESVSLEPLIIPPKGIDVRQSSDMLAISHPVVVKALQIIRQQAAEGLNVSGLLKKLPVCRRTLEFQFRRILGRSVHQEIVRVRIEEAKTLLSETDMDMVDISVRCGFSYASQMTVLFKKYIGQTPRMFRQTRRLG